MNEHNAASQSRGSRMIHCSQNPKNIVVLVHGTWASDADWVCPDSVMVRELLVGLDPITTTIHSFHWSGGNSPGARQVASITLRKFLEDMAQSFGSAQIVLICHSHGGNVALSAIAGTHLGNVSVACLSTPFLRSRLRTLAASTTVVLHVLTFVLYAICAERLDSFVVWFSHSLDFIPLLVTLEIIGGAWLLWSYLSWLPESLYRFGAAFNQSVNFEVDQRLRLLIVRMTHDEASMGLVTSGFLEWLLNKYSRFVDGLVQNRRVLFIYFGAVVCLLITGKLEVVAQNRIVHMFLWPVLAAVIASLLLPTVFSFIALGADASIGIMTQSVSIDTTPIGHWEVNLFEPIQNVRGLAHSQTYSDERCVKLVVGWIKSHNQASAEVSMEFR